MRMSSSLYTNIRRITEGAMDFAHILQNILAPADAPGTVVPPPNHVDAIASPLTDLSKPAALLLPNASDNTDLLSQLLDLHQADQTSGTMEDSPTLDGISSPSLFAATGTIGMTSSRTNTLLSAATVAASKVPGTLGALHRPELGQVLRRAGEGYRYALYLAAAQLVRERVLRAIADRMPEPNNKGSEERVALLNSIARDFTLLNQINDDPDTPANTTDLISGDNASDIDSPFLSLEDVTSVSSQYAALYRAELHRVLRATEFVLEAIDTFQLDGVWHLKPAFSGRALLEMFPKLPQGPVIAEVSFLLVRSVNDKPISCLISLL